jgi:aspartate racemase
MLTIGITAVTPKGGMESMQYITRESKRRYSGEHPRIIIESTSTHKYIEAVEKASKGNKMSLVELLLDSTTSLFLAGAELIIIPNNSVMSVFEEINAKSPVKILDLAGAVSEECQLKNYSSVCIIGPTPLIKSKVYQKSLESLEINVVTPEGKDQEFLHQEIMQATKEGKAISQHAKTKIHQILAQLKNIYGFEAVIAACSEMSSILSAKGNKNSILNPFEILAEKALKEAVINYESYKEV